MVQNQKAGSGKSFKHGTLTGGQVNTKASGWTTITYGSDYTARHTKDTTNTIIKYDAIETGLKEIDFLTIIYGIGYYTGNDTSYVRSPSITLVKGNDGTLVSDVNKYRTHYDGNSFTGSTELIVEPSYYTPKIVDGRVTIVPAIQSRGDGGSADIKIITYPNYFISGEWWAYGTE